MMTEQILLYFLRREVEKRTTLPSFEEDQRIFNLLRKGTNCYAYAFRWHYFLRNGGNNYMPGFLSHTLPSIHYYTWDQLRACTISDVRLTGLNIHEVGEYDEISSDAYRVGLSYGKYLSEGKDQCIFHYWRENEDGSLSEKPCWNLEVSNGSEIMDNVLEDYDQITYFEVENKVRKRTISC